MPDGTAKLLGVPFTPLLSFLVDGKNLEGREFSGQHSRGCSTTGSPRGLQEAGTPTHVLQQRLLPHGLHQAFGVHVSQPQDVQGAAVFVERGDVVQGMQVREQVKVTMSTDPP